MSEVSPWQNLHPDLLNQIAKFMYSYGDYLRLRSVCKSWNLNLPQIPNHTRNPWLVLPFAHQTRCLEEKEIYHLTLPEMQNTLFRGSCYGWLIIVDISNGALQMLNPFTKIRFNLPPISTFPNIIAYQPHRYENYIVQDLDDGLIYGPEGKQVHENQIKKIVISSPPDYYNYDLMAVAIYGPRYRLAFYKIGNRWWTEIPTENVRYEFEDVIFHDRKIYAVDSIGQLYEFDMDSKPTPLGGICKVKPPIDFITPSNLNTKYLIRCPNGNLLMVVRHFVYAPGSRGLESQWSCRTINFDIYMLTKEKLSWSKLRSLGNYASVLGLNSSLLVSSHTSYKSNGNQIYYTDNMVKNHSEKVGGQDIGVLDLEDGITSRPFPDKDFLCPPPVWLLTAQDF